MSDEKQAVSLSERAALIAALPSFSMLAPAEVLELAALMNEKHYATNDIIVEENTVVDSVLILVDGFAEVTHQEVKQGIKKKILSVPLAVLGPSEAIGLNETGFYSTTGVRMATVTAIVSVKALELTIKDLREFFSKHPHIESEMVKAADEFLRVSLIKQSLPFAYLKAERTKWLADKIEEIFVPAGTVIFKQGDAGDSCYLIRSGEVDIIANDDGEIQKLATLKSPALFGEATLITKTPRNATAVAVKDTQLLLIKHTYLSELIETQENVANMFMTLMVDRSRPQKNPRVSPHPRETVEGEAIVILKNPDNGKYFKLSKEGYFIWQQMNGQQTLPAITMALSEKFNIFSPDIVTAIISKLAHDHFIVNVELEDETLKKGVSLSARLFAMLKRCAEIRYAFGDADAWITKMYNKIAYLFFTRIGILILSSIAFVGFFAFLFSSGDTISTFQIMPSVWLLIIPFVPAMLISVALHELGHAFATKSFGQEVHYMGVGWFWVGPVAFTDTSDMWLKTRGPRTVVNLAGVFMDVVVSGICGILILMIANPYIQAFLWIFALYTYINAFRMLSPLQELDGYYVLMDLLDKPQLRHAAVLWLLKDLPTVFRKPGVFKNHKPEVIYWIACIIFLVFITIITLLIQVLVLKIFGWQPHNRYLMLSLPLLVALISGIGIIDDIRNQAD